jgi:quinol monooxygenase YgiN
MSDHVIVTAVLSIKPEFTDSFSASLPTLFEDTAKQKGFRSIRADRHETHPNKILLVEEWETPQDYRNYVAWRESRGDLGQMAEVMSAAPELNIWSHAIGSATAQTKP